MKNNTLLRLFSVLLVIFLTLSFSACGQKSTDTEQTDSSEIATDSKSGEGEKEEEQIDPMAKYEPAIEVTSVKFMKEAVEFAEGESYENNIWINGYKEDLGINLKWKWMVPQAQAEEKLNISIASNDLPDIIPVPNLRTLNQLVRSGVATDLTQLIEDYATPFTKKMFGDDSYTAITQVTVDGKVRALPLINGNTDQGHILYVRTDWLDVLGLELPKTIYDVYEIAEEFVENDPDKNGEDDTFGIVLDKNLFGQFATLEGIFAAYGAYPKIQAADGWIKDDSGKIIAGTIQPEVKEALGDIADLYKKGIIDPEFGVKDMGKVAEIVAAGKVGILFAQHWIPFWPLPDSFNNHNAQWKSVALVSKTSEPARPMVNGSIGELMYVVNDSMENKEAAIKLYNYYYEKDCALSEGYDEEFHQDVDVKYTRYHYAVMQSFHPQQNISIYRGVKEYQADNDASKLNPWTKGNAEAIEKWNNGDVASYGSNFWAGPEGSLKICDYYINNDLYETNAYLSVDTESMTKNGSTLDKLRLETFTKIIMGAVPIYEFDQYVENWKKLGGDKIIEEVNSK